MNTQEVKRKLTAILNADVKGYSRLMGADEEGTLSTLTAYREVMTTLIQQHHGRVVNAPGDALLAEFESVVDAVKSAIEIQRELVKRNSELATDRRMEYRMGINLGDVMVDGDSIYGDGVNIAARLESLADAGGICVSGTAFDQVKTKLPLGYEYLGEQTVKNIAEPVRVYRVLMEPEAAGKVIGEKKAKPRQWHMVALGLGIAVIVVVAAIVIWKLYTSPLPKPEIVPKEKITAPLHEKSSITVPPSAEVAPKERVTPPSSEKPATVATATPPVEKADPKKMAFPLPDQPSIAVLPFVNMSGDPAQNYMGDGLSEDIITALSKVGRMLVIARESSFSYKGKPVKVHQVAQELGVRYVLEGSVRRSGSKLRVTAQLIDAIKGHHLWAGRYDRELKEIFAVQDEITKQIITSLHVTLTEGEEARVHARGTQSLDAYLKLLEARDLKARNNKEDNAKARELFEQALAVDPNYAAAYRELAASVMLDVWLGASKSPRDSLMKSIELAKKATSLDNSMASAYGLLGMLYTMIRQHEKGIEDAQRAVELDPSSAYAHYSLGFCLNYAGRPEEAVPHLEKAIRLNPFCPNNFLHQVGYAYRETGQYDKAIATQKKALQVSPKDVLAYIVLTSSLMYAGREEEARAAAEEILRIDPNFSLERFAATNPQKDAVIKERVFDSLRKAGLK